MNERIRRRIHFMDKAAKWVITFGGVGVIICMVVMMVLMVRVALPLFGSADDELQVEFSIAHADAADANDVLAFSVGDHLERGYALGRQGQLSEVNLKDGTTVSRTQLRQDVTVVKAFASPDNLITVVWSDGLITLEQVRFKSLYDQSSERRVEIRHETLASFEGSGAQNAIVRQGEGRQVCVEQLDGRLAVRIKVERENLFGDVEVSESSDQVEAIGLVDFTVSSSADRLYLGMASGKIEVFDISGEGLDRAATLDVGSSIDHIALLYGDVSLAVATNQGLSIWFESEGSFERVHELASDWAGAKQILPSRRDKSILALMTDGRVNVYHATSERRMLTVAGPQPLDRIMLNYQGLGLIGRDPDNRFWVWEIHNPHPEVSISTLWSKVWYEGYPEPAFVWQSSAATDDFEPKMSLVPLLLGSLKGTFYSLIFALPIAIFGAMYTSYLMDPRWKRFIKPAVELMAAIPTVVIGFLAALWLAPRLENDLPAVFVSLLTVPLTVMVGMWALRFVFNREREGLEFLKVVPFVLLGALIAAVLGGWIQDILFSGDFNLWYFQAFEKGVDQRNCVVIAFALGFAVIPIIFTISEDALSNVPPHVTAASLALGATPWQTLWRVVLPMASPGIFAAAMIGLGRAVGETMIVLMATGNTPIMDWSIFNGMRTLAANIAVEIPEAPVNGSLYRVLFLTALLLFCLTFVVNTAAEFVRHALRKKYGQF